MIQLTTGKHRARIDAGELVGYQVGEHEFIHQKGSPGWRNSDTEMFPIIGPTNEAGFRVQTPRGPAVQDQHGLLRELTYELVSRTETSAVFKKRYRAGTLVHNSKYPHKSSEAQLSWPYNFEFTKSFELQENGLAVVFQISGEEGMPFMLGYHPAFKLYTPEPVLHAQDRIISLAEVLAVGSRALPVLNCQRITLEDEKWLTLTTEGFHHFMLWTEAPNMLCIEPITFYPYEVTQSSLHAGFGELCAPGQVFTVRVQVGD